MPCCIDILATPPPQVLLSPLTNLINFSLCESKLTFLKKRVQRRLSEGAQGGQSWPLRQGKRKAQIVILAIRSHLSCEQCSLGVGMWRDSSRERSDRNPAHGVPMSDSPPG
jgi:hypothetical protein